MVQLTFFQLQHMAAQLTFALILPHASSIEQVDFSAVPDLKISDSIHRLAVKVHHMHLVVQALAQVAQVAMDSDTTVGDMSHRRHRSQQRRLLSAMPTIHGFLHIQTQL
jgi:hypothetical protein